MAKQFTAKVKVRTRDQHGGNSGQVTVTFEPDYAEGRNAEWAEATPSLSLSMNVKADVVEGVQVGDAFTLTFEKAVD